MPGWVGYTSLVIPDVTSGSAYAVGDAVGSAFEVELAAGEKGGAVFSQTLIEQGIQRPNLRMHMFSTGFSGSVNGVTWALGDGDEPNYLGYVDFSVWVSAGAAKSVSTIQNPGAGIASQDSGTRSLHAQLQALGAFTGASAGASGYRLNTLTFQD